ncbi:Alpha/Beta hydrolase protein [Crepidotus variabilis]|uniref:Alpha/Beta hydrolase protein n=1 Tax=Crepidotus variabilis TaxID=179855 RepID=A0A9P6EN65_9AGAR|nr:Alpha/Beta hydrolase protein [Crepidotus variabilis]
MYVLFCAWVVNWGTDPRAGQILERPYSPTAQEITLVRNGARALAMEFESFIDLSLTPWDPTSKTPSAGPFAGVFKPKTGEPFLILAFKGTTYEWEVNTDALFGAVAVNPEILYGLKAHQGMSRNLFKPFEATGRTESAFDIIFAKLEATAANIKGNGTRKIPVYVTGHSLGAGFAILAYMEFIRRLEIKPSNNFSLQDLWNYGAPRVFLAGGAQKMAAIVKDTNFHVYRAANFGDLVPTLPPIFGTHVDIGYKIDPEAATPEEYITERPSELDGRKPDDPVPSPDTWQKHWPPVYYRGIRKYLNPDE